MDFLYFLLDNYINLKLLKKIYIYIYIYKPNLKEKKELPGNLMMACVLYDIKIYEKIPIIKIVSFGY